MINRGDSFMKTLYDKSNLGFAIAWIAVYCIFMSVADAVSLNIGLEKSVTFFVGLLLSFTLLLFLKRHCLFTYYGLCRSGVSAKSMLYYLPALILLTANTWHGISFNKSPFEIIFHILSMLCVGFLEEVIFRGLLLNAMRKDNETAAVIVSSVTFGLGHIINLINGSGAELFPNLMQIVYATAAGFMFVMIYLKTKSLIGCIAIHGIFNALSVFSDETNVTKEMQIIFCVLLTTITGAYAIYLAITMKKNENTSVQ